MREPTFSKTVRYAAGFTLGLVAFIAFPESIRWFHGGAIAQNLYGVPPNTTVGTIINGNANFSATGAPGQTEPVIGGQTNVTGCPGQGNVVGTYVGPGSHMTATATGNGGSGAVIGYQSTVTVGGPGCQ